MITSLAITNFQSLRKIELELGLFTVIVGPSSSGKSAFIRACRALVSNVRGTGMITRGQKAMAITATLDTGAKVSLEREERASAYRITGDGTHQFTKLGGEVPDKVTQTLRLNPGRDSINFADQFDKPFLLDESGTTIAHTLGNLTNVHLIFDAVRAANKIRTNAQSALKTRRADLELLKSRLADYRDLPDQMAIFARVEQADELRRQKAARIGRLETTLKTLKVGQTALAKATLPELPDDAVLNYTYARYRRLSDRVDKLRHLTDAADTELLRWQQASDDLTYYHQSLDTAMASRKTCPTCGQEIKQLDGRPT